MFIFKKLHLKRKVIFFIIFQMIIGPLFSIFLIPQETQAAPGTRTKTVEYFVGQYYGTGIASATVTNYDFTVYLPDAISSASVVRSAYIEYNSLIGATDATATNFQLGLVGSLTSLSAPAVIDQTGESTPVGMKLDATAKLQSIIQGAGTFNLRFTTSITGPIHYGESAKLMITYDYNDAATTQVKTIYAWVHSQAATVASAGTVTSAIFNLGLPESSITSRSTWIETRGYVNAALTTGFYWNAETQRDIVWNNTLNSYGYVALVSPTSTYNPNTNNTFTIKSVSGAFSAPTAILGYTYSFDYSASTELMNSLKILLYQGTETASTATLTGNKVINIPEASITMKSSFLQGRAVRTAVGTLGMNAQLGSTPGTTAISILANAAETSGFPTTIVWHVTSNLSTMTSGDSTVYWAYSASAATNIRGLTLYLNYKYNKASTTSFNFQAEYHVGQQTAASTTWSQAFTPAIADSNYTLKQSFLNHQFNENATLAPTATIGIVTTAAYLFLGTGENVTGEVWHDTSANVTALGSQLTATLNNNQSSTKSASFLVWWQYLAIFEQKQENWRWYNDNTNVPPADGNALAAENTAPTNTTDIMVLRLRISIKETGGANQSAASVRKLQWSTSPTFVTSNDVDIQGGSGIWRYYNGPATDGTDVSVPYKLTLDPVPITGGKYCESNTPTYQLPANQVAEFEYTIQGNGTLANQTYYFRLWDNSEAAEVELDTDKTYPSLTCAFQGSLTLSGVNVTWTNVNPDNPPDNTGKGLTCTVTTNGGWQVKVATSSGDSQGRLWSAANSLHYDGTFTYTSSGAAGPTYQTTPTSFTTSPGTNVANYTSAVTNWDISVSYTLGVPTWVTLAGTYTATHTYTLSAL
jgi:hypothetical protein